MNAKNTKKSPIHENSDANITCDFGDISSFRSRLPHTHVHIVCSIIVRLVTVSIFYHLGGVNVFHHERLAFSVSGHLWVNVIDEHVSRQSGYPFHV